MDQKENKRKVGQNSEVWLSTSLTRAWHYEVLFNSTVLLITITLPKLAPGPNCNEEMQSNDGRWGGGRRSYGGFDDERRAGHPPPSRVSDFDQPSRADEVDNWDSVKKPLPSFDSGRQNRYESLGGGSRAEATDNWALSKKPVAARSSAFGSGFRDSGSEPDRWTRGDRERERPRLGLDAPTINEAVVKPNPFGAARPREEVLTDKGLDWKKIDFEVEAKKTSRPTSAHSSTSSRPSSAHSTRSEDPTETIVVKARPKVNPFGDAKPREVLLEERGQDWKKIDLELEHRRVDRPETVEEKVLKEEIDNLKKELEEESSMNSSKESMDEVGGDQTSTRAMLLQKEKELIRVEFNSEALDALLSRMAPMSNAELKKYLKKAAQKKEVQVPPGASTQANLSGVLTRKQKFDSMKGVAGKQNNSEAPEVKQGNPNTPLVVEPLKTVYVSPSRTPPREDTHVAGDFPSWCVVLKSVESEFKKMDGINKEQLKELGELRDQIKESETQVTKVDSLEKEVDRLRKQLEEEKSKQTEREKELKAKKDKVLSDLELEKGIAITKLLREIEGLKLEAAIQYQTGFDNSLEQVQYLHPEIDIFEANMFKMVRNGELIAMGDVDNNEGDDEMVDNMATDGSLENKGERREDTA